MADKLWTTAWTELSADAMVDADKVDDTSSTNKFTTAADITKLAATARFTVSESAPGTPSTGDGWMSTVDARRVVRFSSTWVEV